MNKYIIILCTFILPFGIQAINFEDLDVDNRVKQQILDSFTLRQSIDQFVKDNSNIPVVTVGGDNACDYRIGSTKIQDAINEHTSVEIRIARNDTYNENLVINDNSVSLRGGYANCTDAANNIPSEGNLGSIWTVVGGVAGSKQPVIKILGNTQRNTIILERLLLGLGEGATNEFPGGGISIYQADAQISLEDVRIWFNEGILRGGGVAIIEGDTDITANNLELFFNKAQSGGGIYCDGSEASLTLHFSSIGGNDANGITGGGGISLHNGCSLLMYSGGITGNTSAKHGGGMAISSGSIVTLFGHEICSLSGACFGSNTASMRLLANKVSRGGGGGAYVVGINTMLSIYAGMVTSNEALSGAGGAIDVTGGATFTTGRLSKACWNQEHCNYYAENTAFVFGQGGAIRCHSATMSITNTVLTDNRADLGTAVNMFNCTTDIRSSLIYQNGDYGTNGDWNDKYVIYNSGSAGSLDIHHTTIADNKSLEAVLGSFGGDTNIVASIIHDSSTGSVLGGSTATEVNVECSMLHEDESVTLKAFTIVDDPEFIDRANNNYHINAQTSPAVDYCYTNTGNYRDMDFEERGWDDTSVTNLHGPYDIGADETYGNDIIFANGFE
ncbi:hypothetical protein MNBD_GAMMA01-1346 [hydrothermal vent metagenome]|uniref:Uncharacterized protein n=1 Tax=hydrothermal vent metagenome TaxID=652676 RepID=A0A3B0VJ93_9ZZZZ